MRQGRNGWRYPEPGDTERIETALYEASCGSVGLLAYRAPDEREWLRQGLYRAARARDLRIRTRAKGPTGSIEVRAERV
jgi:hypothetical protein